MVFCVPHVNAWFDFNLKLLKNALPNWKYIYNSTKTTMLQLCLY